MRKLASIQTVNTTEPIPNADAIEKIRVLGWWVVVKKGEFRPGDKVVYCEIDSLLPERTEFEFLRANCYKPAQIDATGAVTLPAGFRIKTIKLRGQVSQGICFPLAIVPEGSLNDEDADVTDSLGIRKWEPPQTVGMGGRVKELPRFPAEDRRNPRTDSRKRPSRAQRARVLPHGEARRYFVYRVHSARRIRCVQPQHATRHERRSQRPGSRGEEAWSGRTLAFVRRARGFDTAIQGEVIGPGVQQNKYALRK